MEITKEKVVTIHYTLKNDQGEVIDSSEGQEPMPYLQGFGNIVPGLELALEGKSAGDKINVSVAPEEAYGKRNDQLVQQLQAGAQLPIYTEKGVQLATITDIKEGAVTLDLNHPLADETLHFDVEVVDVRAAAAEELQHGHVHGPGGHQH